MLENQSIGFELSLQEALCSDNSKPRFQVKVNSEGLKFLQLQEALGTLVLFWALFDQGHDPFSPSGPMMASSCVQGRSEMVYGYIKRHTAKIRYNLLPPPFTSWNRHPKQLRQRLIPLRRIQSSGAFRRSASTAGIATSAKRAAAPAYASTASSATSARCAAAPAYALTASSAEGAESAKTSRAPLKAAHDTATVSPLSTRY